MVPGAGIEPARCCHRGILSPLRLPVSPPGQTRRDCTEAVRKDQKERIWRLSPESNRGPRLCRPLHNHSATQPMSVWRARTEKNPGVSRGLAVTDTRKIWSGKRDSNSRPQPWQGCALPTELFPRRVKAHIVWMWRPVSTPGRHSGFPRPDSVGQAAFR